MSGLDGTVVITPLESVSSPEITLLAAATGTAGFLSLELHKLP
jgi:hypothetical protein